MPTGQVIVNGALTALGILEQGGVPSVSDSNDTLNELNIMWNAWGIDEDFIYAVLASRYQLAANVGVYTIGTPTGISPPPPNFNSPRPARIYGAAVLGATGNAINANALYAGGAGYVVNDTGVVLGANGTQATYTVNTVSGLGAVLTYTVSGAGTGYSPMLGAATATGGAQPGVGTGFRISISSVTAGGQNRNELTIIDASRYYAHNDLAAVASTPDELYPDYNVDANGYATLYLYPIPLVLAAQNLELQASAVFSAWTLTGTYLIPQGYQDALQYALAFRLLPRFGVAVSQETAQLITGLGLKGEQRIKSANMSNRRIPQPPSQPAQAGAPSLGA